MHRDLEVAVSRPERFHRHLGRPAIRQGLGFEHEQAVDPDRTHRPEVADFGSVHPADQRGGEAVAETLEDRHRTRLAVTPRANHQLAQSRIDGCHNAMYVVRIVGAIAVEENGDTISCRARSGQARSSIAAAGFTDDLGAGGSCNFGGPIAGAVIDNDDAVAPRIKDCAQTCHQPANCRLLVETGNHDSQGFGLFCERHTSIRSRGLLPLSY